MDSTSDLIYKQFKDVEKDDFQYIYRGDVTPKLIMNVLDFAKSNLAKAEDTKKLKNRIYYIMGESLQNIARHQVANDTDSADNSAVVVIHKKKNKYYIVTGNLMPRAEEDILKDKLDHINSLTPEELNDFCRDIRLTTGFTEKSGASLGLIEMAKKSGNKLQYSMAPVDDTKTYFYLSTEVLTQTECVESDYEFSLPDIIDTHNFLKNNEIILSFKGDFNQDNLLSLLSILNNGMNASPVRIKLFSIMVELLQNIVKHADNITDDTSWKAGVFYICEQDNCFTLLASNYIKHELTDDLKNRFDRINTMNSEQLNEEYKKILFNFDYINPVSTGLGIIDIRRKSGEKVEYSVKKISNEIDFLTVKAIIRKQV